MYAGCPGPELELISAPSTGLPSIIERLTLPMAVPGFVSILAHNKGLPETPYNSKDPAACSRFANETANMASQSAKISSLQIGGGLPDWIADLTREFDSNPPAERCLVLDELQSLLTLVWTGCSCWRGASIMKSKLCKAVTVRVSALPNTTASPTAKPATFETCSFTAPTPAAFISFALKTCSNLVRTPCSCTGGRGTPKS
mmetsp:Transcript_72280/g.200508  ORF Transcript_72280/g.200508 Transcript_72280/m.200508 type:complete len:201 (+) Transcript_72280:395-997(+)